MIKHAFTWIHKLRLWFLVLIVVGFLYVVGLNPVSISVFLGAKFGSAIGMSINIPENPFNKLAAQLKDKEEELAQKENELLSREQAIAKKTISQQRIIIIMLGIGITILFVLVIINYYLDFKRRKGIAISRSKQ